MATHGDRQSPKTSLDYLRGTLSPLSPRRPWFSQLSWQGLRTDLLAALTNAAIVLPQGVAFAIIAGLPPEYGLFTAMVIAVVAGFWGSSMIMVSGPTTAISAVLFATLVPFAAPGSETFVMLALTLTIMVGAIQLAAGFARLGGLISFISHSVIVGFTAAAALLIASSQLAPALGIETERGGGVIERLINVAEVAHEVDPAAALIAGLSLVTIPIMMRISRRIPAYLVALLVGALAGLALDAPDRGIGMFAPLPSVVPSFDLPRPSAEDIAALFPGAVAIAIVGLLEAISIGRAFATRRHEAYDSNQEIVGQGLSNFIGGFFQAYAGSGSFTRSGLNAESGARTPLAAIFSAVWLFLLLLIAAPFVVFIPVPAMAGIILFVAWRLIDFKEIRHIRHSSAETAILVTTFLTGVFIELEYAIVVGVVLSLVFFLYKSAHPFLGVGAPTEVEGRRCFRNADRNNLSECPVIVFLRLQGPIFFASVDELRRDMSRIEARQPSQTIRVLIVKGVGTLDLAGAEFLIDEIGRARKLGGDFFVVTGFPPFISAMDRYGVTDVLGPDNLVPNKNVAIRRALRKVPMSACATCTARVFWECAERPAP